MSKEIKGKKYGRLYLESYKKSIVAEIEREDGAISLVCERHGLTRSAVQHWLDKYASSSYFENRQKRRSPALKNKVIREILSGRSTINEVQLKYSIDCRNTITNWLKKYKKTEQELSGLAETDLVPQKDMQLIEMQKELEMARLKIRALEIVVDIASDQFKVDIRKKFGAKQ
jgi:transposase